MSFSPLLRISLLTGAGAGVLLLSTAHAATVDVGWTAVGETDGALASWSTSTNTFGGTTAQWNGSGTKASGSSNFANINDWVSSPDYNLAGTGNSWQNAFGNATTQLNASWELVLRPGSFSGNRHIFNTGGNGDGTAFLIEGSTIRFIFQDADAAANRVDLSFDLAGLGGTASDFYHIVGTSDVQSAGTGTGELWVNGSSVAGPTTSTSTINDWDGGDVSSLGSGAENHNIPTTTGYSSAAFTGDIALFNFYSGEILDATDVADAFAAVNPVTTPIPEPSTAVLSVLGIASLLLSRRRQ